MLRYSLIALFAAAYALAADPMVVRLFPNGAPNSWTPPPGGEKSEERGKDGVVDRSLSNIIDPIITIFQPPVTKRTGASILIAPGGGYSHLAYDKEGLDIAKWLNTFGITGIVLKYRMPEMPKDAAARRNAMFGDAKESAKAVHVAMEDAKQAMKLIRENARAWNLDKDRVGMMGFSAGGHLAALMGMEPDEAIRPNFLALLYPAMPEKLYVTKDTPQTFLAHADDDGLTSENSIRFYLALKKEKVPAELHIFSGGGHGFGIRKSGKTSESWPERFEAWFKAMKCPCEN